MAMMAANVQPVNISTQTDLSEAEIMPEYETGNMMAQSLAETEADADVYADGEADADFSLFSKVKSFFSRGKKKKEEEERRKRNEANRRAARKQNARNQKNNKMPVHIPKVKPRPEPRPVMTPQAKKQHADQSGKLKMLQKECMNLKKKQE